MVYGLGDGGFVGLAVGYVLFVGVVVGGGGLLLGYLCVVRSSLCSRSRLNLLCTSEEL